jgi:hypothetical protein
MFIEVEVEAGDNCDFSFTRIYISIKDPKLVTRVQAPSLRGEIDHFVVTGWSAEGPTQARLATVDDSGEGTVLLVYGGDEGIRLRPAGSNDQWSLDAPNQWAEPCLLLDPNAQFEIPEER